MDYAKIKRPSTLIGIEALPAELVGLETASLLDLDWTDATLGYHGYAYWPVEDEFAPLLPGQAHGTPNLQAQGKKRRVLRHWPAVELAAEAKQGVLQDQLRETLTAIDTERDRRIAQGKRHTFPDGQTGMVQLRHERDLVNVNAVATSGTALMALGDTTATVAFRDAADVTHALTGSEAVQFGLAVMAWVSAHYAAAWAHKDAVKALAEAQDVAGLMAYDVSQGWPTTEVADPLPA